MNAKCKDYELKLVEPEFSSNLTDLIIDLNNLRDKRLTGSTHPLIFFQLKNIFHRIESIESARIEGNNTTVSEYIETAIENPLDVPEKIREIQNVEKAMNFIEEHIEDYPINKMFVRKLHEQVVSDLNPSREGDSHPGCFRCKDVRIANTAHCPPNYTSVPMYMDELLNFLSKVDMPKYDLLKIAIAHHRFVWIHPFSNGNGRTVRLLTYAMLVKAGFNVAAGRIINPTAVFCNNRTKYYDYLAKADSGKKKDILNWCYYVLKGLEQEVKKIDKLLDYTYLKNKVLFPAIDYSMERKYITQDEYQILKEAVVKQVIKAADLKILFPNQHSQAISRKIKKLLDKNMLRREKEGSIRYVLSFDNNYLLRGIMPILDKEGFLPD